MDLTWLFDLDDTLISNHHDYAHAQIALAQFLFEVIGYRAPDLQSIINLHVEIDTKNVKSMGFRQERFPTSCQQTYEEICRISNLPVNEEYKRVAYNIGMQAFDDKLWKKKEMLDGAEETLDFLTEQGDELLLLTKGDQNVQEKKVEVYQLHRFFNPENIHIVPQKNVEVILKVVGERDKSRVYSVGNSIRSDVEPSIVAGLKVIYIPCETWQYEREHQGVSEHFRLITLDNLLEIKNQYRRF